MVRALAFIAALLAAPVAAAQAPDAPPTAAQVEAARAHADKVVAAADAGPFFENVTINATPTVRHRGSGMTCAFVNGDPRDNIRLYPEQAGGPKRGEDVSCGSWLGDTFVSLYATRYPGAPSREAIFRASMADVPRGTPGARLHQGELSSATVGDQAPPLIGGYDMQLGGRPVLSLVIVQHIGEWSFKARATGPEGDASVNLLASIAFAMALPGGREAVAR
jgi:hypothetical protein